MNARASGKFFSVDCAPLCVSSESVDFGQFCQILNTQLATYQLAARVRVRLDHVAVTDLTHFRIFPRNLEPDFTHYWCEQRKENGNL